MDIRTRLARLEERFFLCSSAYPVCDCERNLLGWKAVTLLSRQTQRPDDRDDFEYRHKRIYATEADALDAADRTALYLFEHRLLIGV